MIARLLAALTARHARITARSNVKAAAVRAARSAVSTGRYGGDSKVPATFHPQQSDQPRRQP